MAFYEMLPGAGMPSGLQADMDSVLNKKFGTSTTYPAAGWPDDVNLLGMLEEKTVSGAIAHFDDGADTVPLKSLVASIVPIGGKGTPQSPIAISGVDAVKITHTGKNMLNPATCQRGYIEGGGGIHVPQAYQELYSDYIKVKPDTTYTFSGTVNNSSDKWCGIAYYDKDKNFIIRQAVTTGTGEHFSIGYRTPSNAVYVRCTWRNYSDISSGGSVCPCQFEEGTETSYETYNGATYEVEIPNPNPNLRPSADIDEGMWTTSGTINPSSGGGFGRALTMAVSAKTTYDIYGLLDDLIVYLDSNKTMLSYERLSNTSLSLQNERKTTPANCAYIGLSALASDVSSVSVKESFLVYGGSIDVISGDGVSEYDKDSMSSTYLSGLKSDYIGYEASTAYFGGHSSVWVRNWHYQQAKARQAGGIGCVCNYFPASMNNTTIFASQYRIYFDVDGKNISSVQDFISFVANLEQNDESLDIAYELNDTYTTPFAFDPISIDSKSGNNTIWSEQGSDTEVTYRSQGTTTPILPTLVTKNITENGTYSASDDGADGYSEVTVNVESIAKIGINSGKLNITNGTITADSTYCYTDTFDCPSGIITMDVGEGIVSDYAGIELIYESDGSHANYWQGASRFREVDMTNYYSATKKARLAFKKQYLSKVLLMDFGNGKIYSPLTASQFEEPQASLLSMNSTESEESEEE